MESVEETLLKTFESTTDRRPPRFSPSFQTGSAIIGPHNYKVTTSTFVPTRSINFHPIANRWLIACLSANLIVMID